MADAVLDASAILALLRAEPGFEQVDAVIATGLVSVVNEAEVVTKLVGRGFTPAQALNAVGDLPYRTVDLDRNLAQRAGVLWQATKAQGLSFGDRCCLALAERERLPVLTSDRLWSKLSLDIEVRLIAGRGNR